MPICTSFPSVREIHLENSWIDFDEMWYARLPLEPTQFKPRVSVDIFIVVLFCIYNS